MLPSLQIAQQHPLLLVGVMFVFLFRASFWGDAGAALLSPIKSKSSM